MNRSTKDFFSGYKNGEAIDKLLKGKWDRKKVEKHLDDKIDKMSPAQSERMMNNMGSRLSINGNKYESKPFGEYIDAVVDGIEKKYSIPLQKII